MLAKKKATSWFYVLPAMMMIITVVVFPIGYTGYISVTNMNLSHWYDFKIIGLSNYIRALTKLDAGFLGAVVTTVIWTVVNMVLQVILSYLIALGLNHPGLKLGRLYKTLLMFPWAMPGYVSVLLWRVGMFNTEFGLINQMLTTLGFDKVNLLASNVPAFLSCTVLNLWLAMPFMIMMIDGALQSVDRSYYESARMDGAGFIRQNINITIPVIKPIIMPSIIMTTFTTFKQFDIVYLLTRQKGYYTGATFQTIITYAHENAFVTNNYGLSSAISILIFIIIVMISMVMNKGVDEE